MSARGGSPEADVADPLPTEVVVAGPERRRRRGSPLAALAGASLVLIGAGAVGLSSFSEDGSVTARVGPDAPVNVGAGDPRDINAHNSPTLVRNPVRPANLAVAGRIDTPFFSCALHVSTDAGRTWSQTEIPAPRGEEAKCFAPDLAFAADGTLHLSFVTLKGKGNVPNAVWLSRSTDSGRTLSNPVKVAGRLAFQVRLAADPARPRRVYMTWLQGIEVGTLKFTQPGNPINVARSDDGGRSWTRPVRVSDPARRRVVTPAPVVGPAGELYVLYLDLGADRLDYEGAHRGRGGPSYGGHFKLVLARSVDEGRTWKESPVAERLVPIQRFIVFLPPFPSVAVDRSGRLYAGFHDGVLGDPDVWVWSLARGGSAWEGPTRVNDTKRRDGTWQYLPKLSVAPDGRLDVLYYDRRSDPRNIRNHVSLQSSFDGARSFTAAMRLSTRSFDSRIGLGAPEGLPDLGSRLGLISTESRAIGLWTDTRAGSRVTHKQDLATASVKFSDSGPRFSGAVEHGLRYGGAILVLAGLGLVGLWLRRGRSGSARPGDAAWPSE